jgi:acetylornithine deacetylase
MPDLGASALLAMGRVLVELETFSSELTTQKRLEEHLERPYVTLNPGIVQGGSAINIVADHCELTLGYRPLPGDDPLEVHHRLERRLAELALPVGTSVHTRLGHVTPSLLTPPGTTLEQVLLPHASDPTVGAAPFATDGGNLSKLNLEPLVFGPGCIEVAHRADEYIDARALERSVTIIRDVIEHCCHRTTDSEQSAP